MTDSAIISDPLRQPITAQRHEKGGVVIRGPHTKPLILSQSELDRLVAFVRDEPVKARIQSYAVAPESPQTDE